MADIRKAPIIPKGRVQIALGGTRGDVDFLEREGILKFEATIGGRKYTTIESLTAAAEFMQRSENAA